MWGLIIANRIALIGTNPSPDYRSNVVKRLEDYFKCPPWNVKSFQFINLGVKATAWLNSNDYTALIGAVDMFFNK